MCEGSRERVCIDLCWVPTRSMLARADLMKTITDLQTFYEHLKLVLQLGIFL